MFAVATVAGSLKGDQHSTVVFVELVAYKLVAGPTAGPTATELLSHHRPNMHTLTAFGS